MSGVYNRKLFRQSSARDELRRMGGIMASSEELLREAMNTAQEAPRPSDLGPMAPAPQAPAPAMPQPMMGQPMPQPMMGQPMMPAPMMAGQPMMGQPMMPAPMMAAPAFMPPMVPQSAQMPVAPAPVQGYAGGGFVLLPGMLDDPKIDVTKPAGTVVEPPSVDAEVVAKAEDLMGRVDEEDPQTIGAEIVDTAATRGAEVTGNLQADLAAIYQNLTGDPAAYEKNIDALNRGILGAAIAAGTSARATENIAKGMLVGLEAARDTEERRVRDARALQLAQLQAQAKGGAGGVGSRDYRNPVDAYQDAYQSVMNAGEFDLQIPEGMTREEYADQVATALIARSYSPAQLVGTPFEGVAGTGRTASAAGATQTAEDVLQSARQAIAAGAPEAAVRERLAAMGIDPGAL